MSPRLLDHQGCWLGQSPVTNHHATFFSLNACSQKSFSTTLTIKVKSHRVLEGLQCRERLRSSAVRRAVVTAPCSVVVCATVRQKLILLGESSLESQTTRRDGWKGRRGEEWEGEGRLLTVHSQAKNSKSFYERSRHGDILSGVSNFFKMFYQEEKVSLALIFFKILIRILTASVHHPDSRQMWATSGWIAAEVADKAEVNLKWPFKSKSVGCNHNLNVNHFCQTCSSKIKQLKINSFCKVAGLHHIFTSEL